MTCWNKTNSNIMANTLTFHNTPSFYLAYMENWLTHQRNAKAKPAEIAIVEDLKQLVELGVQQLTPVPAEPAKQ